MKSAHYDTWVKIGLNILYYRKEQRLTQAQLAEMCGKGVSTNHLQRVETGESGASLDFLLEVAEALQIPLYKLFVFKE